MVSFRIQGDQWQYWRVRVDQGYRLGYYSPLFQYRVPTTQSIFDGTENYTLELSRGSIFETTGDVPNVNDSSTDSISTKTLAIHHFWVLVQIKLLVACLKLISSTIFLTFIFHTYSNTNLHGIGIRLGCKLKSVKVQCQLHYLCAIHSMNYHNPHQQTILCKFRISRTTLDSGNSGNKMGFVESWTEQLLYQQRSISFKLSAVTGQSIISFNSILPRQ